MKKIVIDLLGSDYGQETLLLGAVEALKGSTNLKLVLIGDESYLKKVIENKKIDFSLVEIHHAESYIKNDEAPTLILKDAEGKTSLSVAYNLLKSDQETIGLISCGNTGAVLVGAIYKLGLIENVKRPCLASALSTYGGKKVYLADCGANVDAKSDMLVNFAYLTEAYAASDALIAHPKVALLSVGSERHKGNLVSKEAYLKLTESNLNFIGNVEGYDILNDKADVIICDGFSGNIVLKNIETIGKQTIETLKLKIQEPKYNHSFEEMYKFYDYNNEGGAVLLGTNKIVIKAHGKATTNTIKACIKELIHLDDNKMIEKMKKHFQNNITEETSKN